MTKSIKEVLMERDGLTTHEADDIIADATKDLYKRLADGENVFGICIEGMANLIALNQLM